MLPKNDAGFRPEIEDVWPLEEEPLIPMDDEHKTGFMRRLEEDHDNPISH